MPGFAGRLAALEAEIRSFYPYEVKRIPGVEPRFRLKNGSDRSLEVTIEGGGLAETVAVAPGGETMVVFVEPGLAELTIVGGPEDREVTLFAEPRTLIDIPLVPTAPPT